MRFIKLTFLLAVAALTASCSTTLSDQGKKVAVFPNTDLVRQHECKYLGRVTTEDMPYFKDLRVINSMNFMREEAAKNGANAIVSRYTPSVHRFQMDESYTMVGAYKCPGKFAKKLAVESEMEDY